MHLSDLVAIYRRTHNAMRDIDGLQPQEAFDELLKFLFYKQLSEEKAFHDKSTPKQIRTAFSKYLVEHNSWSTSLWRDREFHLSDQCLVQCRDLFMEVKFTHVDYDIRSAALREFLTADIRKGLGIYLTPDEVVREVVRFVDPKPTAKCLDPACGSGTFLIELAKHWGHKAGAKRKVWGADKNPRMLLISELNLGHIPGIVFTRQLMDSIVEPNQKHTNDWCRPEYFDFVLTNPPFGVTLDTSRPEYVSFDTAHNEAGLPRIKQTSEWLFIEQSLRWLKPGGTLAIVLPKSIFTNPSFSHERRAIAKFGLLKAVMVLPPETFQVTGAQTNTVVAIVQKFRSSSDVSKKTKVVVATLSNIGYDSTGRVRQNSQLSSLAVQMKTPSKGKTEHISVIPDIIAIDSWEVLTASITSNRRASGGVPLGDLCEVIMTGRTPSRSAYSDSAGLFLVKVGNLTGGGLNWIARDRNFIDVDNAGVKRFSSALRLRSGDILLTSSAHSPVYIAKKVDIITTIPSWVGGEASFVGEVMLIRVKQACLSPFLLLGFLRQPSVAAEIRGMVCGQTAHLHSGDIAKLRVPESLIDPSANWAKLADMLRIEAALNDQLNDIAHQQQEMYAILDDSN